MKTLVLQRPGVIEFVDSPEPPSPGPGEVRLRVKHAGLCGTDIHAYRGRQAFFDYPRILGHELGVEIVDVGPGVDRLQPGMQCAVEPYLAHPGDRAFARGKTNCSASTLCLGVHIDGGMREQIVMPADKVHPSSKLDTRLLALVETLGIGHHAVERTVLNADEIVAVVGAGPIGLSVIQFCILAGVSVTAVDVSRVRLMQVQKLFPDVSILQLDPDGPPLPDAWEAFGERPEAVFDATGAKASMEASIQLPCNGGRVVLVGIYNGNLSFSNPDFHRRELSIIGSRNSTARNFREIIHLMEEGRVRPQDWITHECSADAFPTMIEAWLKPDSGLLKGVIDFSK